MSFLQECRDLASDGTLEIPELNANAQQVIPDDIKKKTSVVISIMKLKMPMLDRIQVPFITGLVAQVKDKSSDVYRRALTMGEIPDAIPRSLCEALMKKQIKECNADELSILKVLTAYIMLQN